MTSKKQKEFALLPIGFLFLLLSLTAFNDNPVLKKITLGASIIILLASVYLSIKRITRKNN